MFHVLLVAPLLGLLAAWYADQRWLRFDPRAVWWAQALLALIHISEPTRH